VVPTILVLQHRTHQVEEVPQLRVPDVLDDELPDQVVRVVAVAVEVGRQQGEELALLGAFFVYKLYRDWPNFRLRIGRFPLC
jgi:hypothetical protein